jgi:phospholipid/cholesterol/gamma-HCH transport system substrate-binding protein
MANEAAVGSAEAPYVGAPTASDEELFDAAPPRSGRREVWVGIFVLGSMLAGLVTLFTLTDAAMFRGRYIVTTVVQDAGGVRRGDPVQMRGVNIGRVQGFQMVPEGVAIRLELEGAYDVPVDSRIQIKSSGLLGGMTAEVVPGTAARALRRGDAIPGESADGIFAAAGHLGDQAETVLGRVQTILSEPTVSALSGSAIELQSLVGQLNLLALEQRGEIAALTTSLRRSADGLAGAAAGPELARVVARMDSLTLRLDRSAIAFGDAGAALATVLGRVERGEGTLGRLTADAALYDNLNEAATSMRALIEDIKREPRRYFDLRIF